MKTLRLAGAVLAAGLLAGMPLAAQSTNVGSIKVGSSSASPAAVTLTIETSGTLGSIAVLTQGAANLDFTNAGGGTCTVNTAYTAGDTCTVNVNFEPRFAGPRYGAAELLDTSANLLSTGYVQGTGTGPQVNFLPGTETVMPFSVSGPNGITITADGTVYIAVWGDGDVLKETPAGVSYTKTTIGSGLTETTGVAVDGAGNVYINCWGRSQTTKETWTGSAYVESLIGSGMGDPESVAVDGAGNLYVVDNNNNRILKETLSAGSYTQSIVIGYSDPSGVAVDGSGNLYVVGYGGGSITKLTPSSGGYTQSSIGSGLGYTSAVAVDAHGNLYTAATLDNAIVKDTLTASGYVQSTVPSSALDWPWGVGVDQNGNVFINDTYHSRVLKEDYADAPSLSFATTPVGGTSSDSPKTVTVFNDGNADLTFTGLSYPTDFPEASGDSSACTGSSSLSSGQQCDLPIEFSPEKTGSPLSEDVTLTDNALNVPGAQQSLVVSGTATGVATHMSVSAPSSAGAGAPFTITVTALDASGGTATGYAGTVSFTSTDASAVLPAASTLTAGVGTFQVTLNTLGEQTITATDAVNSFTATSGTIDVGATPPGVFPAQASVNLGSQPIGTPSGAQPLNFTIGAGTTVGSIAVVTQGAPNLDFTEATGSTCSAQDYTAAAICTVNVTFAPKFAGLRTGAVVFYTAANDAGTVLGSVAIYGIGTGPQIAFIPSPAITINPVVNGKGLGRPHYAAENGAGDLFITDFNNRRVVEIPAGGGAAIVIDTNVNGLRLNNPAGMAVDGAGDLFIADGLNARVLEVPAGGGAATAIDPTVDGVGLVFPNEIALDGAGDLFIADAWNARVVEVPAGGGTPIAISPVVDGRALSGYVEGLALDAAGDLFIADSGGNRIIFVPADGGAPQSYDPVADGLALDFPTSVVVDAAGNMFIADQYNNRLVEAPEGGQSGTVIYQILNGESLNSPGDVSMDQAGNLFIGDYGNNRMVEVVRSQPPAVNFPMATPVGSTDTTDGTQTVEIQNIGNQALAFTGMSYPVDFPEASGDSSACTGSTSLGTGQACDLPIDFVPTELGPLNEQIVLTDNTLNAPAPGYATQTIQLCGGCTLVTPAITWATPAPIYYGTALGSILNATAQSGSNSVAGSFTYSATPAGGTAVAVTAATILTGGSYTLTANFTPTDTTEYATATGMVQLTVYQAAVLNTPSPAPNPTLGTSETFTWTAGGGVTEYELELGTAHPGSNNLYDSGHTTALTSPAIAIPNYGFTVYARLSSQINKVWQHTDYTFTEPGAPVPSVLNTPSPAPNPTLGTSETFTWTAGGGVTEYELELGTGGPGSSNLYDSGHTTALTSPVVTIPSYGLTVYARLFSYINKVWQHTDYIFAESGTPIASVLNTPSPAPSPNLGTSETFTWTAGGGVTEYELELGTGGPGSSNLYDSGHTTALTSPVVTIPSYGLTVYARLFSYINKVWQHTDYTFTEP